MILRRVVPVFLYILLFVGIGLVQAQERMPITTSSEEAKALFVEGRDLLHNARIDKARPKFDAALEKDPAFVLAHVYRAVAGLSYADREKHLEAAAEVTERAESPEIPEGMRPLVHSWAAIGRAHVAVKKDDAAQAQKEIDAFAAYAAESKSTWDKETLHALEGALALQQKDYAKAIEHFEQAGDDPYAFYQLALAHGASGDEEKARTYYAKVANWNEPSLGLAFVRSKAMKSM